LWAWLVQLLALPAILVAQSPAACPDGRAPAGDMGIRALRCEGPSAACDIFREDGDHGPRHVFAVEPVVTEVAAASDGGAGLEVGDVLVAIDGRFITTREGGRYMAQLPIGQDVAVVVRRGGRIRELSVHTEEGCGVRSLSVTPSPPLGGGAASTDRLDRRR